MTNSTQSQVDENLPSGSTIRKVTITVYYDDVSGEPTEYLNSINDQDGVEFVEMGESLPVPDATWDDERGTWVIPDGT